MAKASKVIIKFPEKKPASESSKTAGNTGNTKHCVTCTCNKKKK